MKKTLIFMVMAFTLSLCHAPPSFAQDSAKTNNPALIDASVSFPVGGSQETFTLHVDTPESVAEIVSEGLYYIKNVPEKGSDPITWVHFAFGIAGLLGSIALYFIANFIRGKPKSRD